jgi:tRNA-intron endonuclease
MDNEKSIQKEEKGRGSELKHIEALLRGNTVVVESSESVKELEARGYGTSQDNNLILNFFEALFLLGKGIITVEDEKTGDALTFERLLNIYRAVDLNTWAKYLIYRDIRSRGYVAREGFGLGIDFRAYERGEYGTATAKYLIFGIQEGQPVSVEELARTLKYAQSLKKQLVLAVLNRRGEIVYYSLSKLTLT